MIFFLFNWFLLFIYFIYLFICFILLLKKYELIVSSSEFFIQKKENSERTYLQSEKQFAVATNLWFHSSFIEKFRISYVYSQLRN